MQLEDVLSQVIDILSHSLGPLSSALSTADWLFQNTKECTPVSAITTLSEAFGIEGFYHQYFMITDFEAVERVQQGQCHGIPSRWMGDTRCWKQASGEILHATVYYKRYWVTSRIALSVNVSIPIWRSRSRRTDIPSCPCWQIWLQGYDHLFRWHWYFCNVTHVSIQDKCSFNQTIWN